VKAAKRFSVIITFIKCTKLSPVLQLMLEIWQYKPHVLRATEEDGVYPLAVLAWGLLKSRFGFNIDMDMS
jgi:hypothetical protein